MFYDETQPRHEKIVIDEHISSSGKVNFLLKVTPLLLVGFDLPCHLVSHLNDVVELLRNILLLDMWQESLESNFCKLLIRQNQTEAPVLDISESLNKSSDRFIIPLPQVGQIGQLHLMYATVEELVELLLQIGLEQYGVGW